MIGATAQGIKTSSTGRGSKAYRPTLRIPAPSSPQPTWNSARRWCVTQQLPIEMRASKWQKSETMHVM